MHVSVDAFFANHQPDHHIMITDEHPSRFGHVWMQFDKQGYFPMHIVEGPTYYNPKQHLRYEMSIETPDRRRRFWVLRDGDALSADTVLYSKSSTGFGFFQEDRRFARCDRPRLEVAALGRTESGKGIALVRSPDDPFVNCLLTTPGWWSPTPHFDAVKHVEFSVLKGADFVALAPNLGTLIVSATGVVTWNGRLLYNLELDQDLDRHLRRKAADHYLDLEQEMRGPGFARYTGRSIFAR